MERLNKILANSNVSSRRKADELISTGRVKVNDVVVTNLGFKVKKSDVILVDDNPIVKAQKVYYALNKPTGYLCTTAKDKKMRCILDLLTDQEKQERLYPIGRLEYDTAGVIILTNDGDLTKRLTSPNVSVEKEYLVRVSGIVIKEKIRQLRKGIFIGKNSDIKCVPKFALIEELDKANQSTLIRLILTNVRNKDIKPMFEKLGHKVKTQTRIRFATISVEGIKKGTYRPLKIQEIKDLKLI